MDKRIFKRLFTRVRVDYGEKTFEHSGFALNVSTHGFFLCGAVLYPGGKLIQARLHPGDRSPLTVSGEIRWAKRVPTALMRVVNQGMGVGIVSPPDEYLQWIGSVVARYPGARKHPRVEAHLEVRFYHHEDFFREYTENISQGGMFIATNRKFDADTILSIEVTIPDIATQVVIKGRVVYFLEPDRAADLGQKAGVGLELVDVDEKTRAVFEEYVKRIEKFYENYDR